ncbi:hypothetical protein ACFOPN_19495 [Xanthomonas hyacinthi]
MRLRTTGSRMAERPAMDGRAGLSGRGDVAPWTAAACRQHARAAPGMAA